MSGQTKIPATKDQVREAAKKQAAQIIDMALAEVSKDFDYRPHETASQQGERMLLAAVEMLKNSL